VPGTPKQKEFMAMALVTKGDLYKHGEGEYPVDDAKALQHYQLALKYGHCNAFYIMGMNYHYGFCGLTP